MQWIFTKFTLKIEKLLTIISIIKASGYWLAFDCKLFQIILHKININEKIKLEKEKYVNQMNWILYKLT